MKKFILLFIYLSFSNLSHAQLYGNEWINFNQDYYKIKIGKEGIYKIDYNTLQSIGFPVNSVDPNYIQLWINGKELPIIVAGASDLKFDNTDYIEFYGTYNDGKLDAPLFPNTGEQPHQYMSLYSDTATYFLTISNASVGKRVVVNNDNNYTGKVADPYFIYEQGVWYNYKNGGIFWDGFGFLAEGFHSEYTEGEGWAATNYNGPGITATFQTPYISSIGPKPYIEVLAHTRGNNTNSYDIDGFNNGVQLSFQPSGTIINSLRVTGMDRYFFRDSITDRSLIGNITSFKTISYILARSPHSVSYYKFIYPRLFNLGDSSNLNFNYTSTNNFIKFLKYTPSKTQPIIYDRNNHTKSIAQIIGGSLYCNLSTSSLNRSLYLLDATSIVSISQSNIIPYKFNELKLQSANTYLIISHQKLDSGARAYQDFLSSSQGGSHIPYLAFVNDIYDQFYYGLKHPESLKNFCRYAINSSTSLKYLLLLGKGQRYNNSKFNQIVNINFDLVPTYGVPPTDYYFVSGYNGSNLNPLLAVGRVPATNNNQIANYLKKLNDMQTYGYMPWKKKILHLAGGSTSSEVEQFTNFQNYYHQIVSQPKWGASWGNPGKPITKQDPSPVDSSLKSKIQLELNSGYALVDYFGHGSTQASDIDFGEAYQLNNNGKYPFFYFNGCGLGNTFDGVSIAEDFLFTKDKGAIGWLAQTTFGFITELHSYSITFHENLTKNITSSFAQNITKTIETYQNSSNAPNKAQCRQMLYMGDPSIKIFDAISPDYTLDITKTSIYPKKVTAEADSFALILTIQNLALHSNDSFGVYVKQNLPNGNSISHKQIFRKGIANNDTVMFWIRNTKGINIKGLNTFIITLDSSNKVIEQQPLGESNNIASLTYYFSSTNAQILFPRKDGIVSSTNVELAAQSLIFNKINYNFIFELDTTPDFNSAYKKNSGSIYSPYIAKTNFALLPIDSIDYYWRVRIDDGSGNNSWDVSTFSMIYNSPQGWSQGNLHKFIETKKSNMGYDSLNNLRFLSKQSNPYYIETSGKNATLGRTIWHDGFPLNWGYLNGDGIALVAYHSFDEERFCFPTKFNQTSYKPWWTNPPSYQTKYFYPTGIAKTCHYIFNTFNKEDRDSFLNLLKNIPKDYNLVIMNGRETNIKNWEPDIFTELEKFGAIKIKGLNEGEPYVLIGKRGLGPGEAIEKLANYADPSPPQNQFFTIPHNFDVVADSGSFLSTIIGPAKAWKFFYRTLKKNDNVNDKVKFNIYGITKNNNESILFNNVTDREINLSSIDAKTFPYLRIEADIEDSIKKTPTAISRWTVLFEGYPEGLINPPVTLYQNKDTLEEGDTLEVKIAYSNISSYDMDSILILTTSINSQNLKDTIELKKYKILKSRDSLIINKKIYTKGLSGFNILNISVNPEMAQPEEYLFNNIWQFPYFIKTDQRNPYLDVVFDGRHITNMEIVSPNPIITITAVDENKFFYIDNANYFKVKLKEPGKTGYRELVPSLNDTFLFVASKGPNDKSKLVFSPLNLKDGIYELSVSVMDAKGNFASDEDYKISFRVITKSTLTNIYPYPNPFTTKTRFIFTLTGDKVPEYFKISVISVSGTVVKEITMDDLGSINIGNNITKYEWDGTDSYGDKLANGVYLYKVTAKLNGKDIELSETAGDAFFKKGFGKLYIMR